MWQSSKAHPLAYCLPGRVSYRAYPGTPPPSVYQVTRGTAFQAAERYVRRLSCGDGYPYHQKPQALQAAERYVQQLSYLYDSWLKWGKKRKCEVKNGWARMYFLMGGADRGTRPPAPRITNALLYQLSHIGKTVGKGTTFFWIPWNGCEENVSMVRGAIDGTRTRDPRLGKPMLYQLSHYRIAYLCAKIHLFCYMGLSADDFFILPAW